MILPILLYHSISTGRNPKFQRWATSPAQFREHLAYLKTNGYTPVSITRMVQSMINPSVPLPPKVIAITFDDALEDFLSGALPALLDYNFPATLYAPTAYMGKEASWLKGLGEGDLPVMSWAQLVEIDQAGIEVGAHSHNHRELDTLPEKEAWEEICLSKDLMEQQLGHVVESFAYPHGYHSALVCRLVARAGFTSACAVKHALATSEDDRFALARVIISPAVDDLKLSQLLAGRGLPPPHSPEKLQTKVWRLYRQTAAHFRRRFYPDQEYSHNGSTWSVP